MERKGDENKNFIMAKLRKIRVKIFKTVVPGNYKNKERRI